MPSRIVCHLGRHVLRRNQLSLFVFLFIWAWKKSETGPEMTERETAGPKRVKLGPVEGKLALAGPEKSKTGPDMVDRNDAGPERVGMGPGCEAGMKFDRKKCEKFSIKFGDMIFVRIFAV